MSKKKLAISDQDLKIITDTVFGEAAGSDEETQKMIIRSMFNRKLSGRSKEFGKDFNEISKKGYYAAKNPNIPYKQAISGKFPDLKSKATHAKIRKMTEAIHGDEDYGAELFYFTPPEKNKLTKNKSFNFKIVKPTGKVGIYETFAY